MFESLRKVYLPKMKFASREVDAEKCTKCGRCYDSCPTYGYTWEKDTVPVPSGFGGFEHACLNCGNCLAVCPVDAIKMDGAFAITEGRYKGRLKEKVEMPNPLNLDQTKTFADFKEDLTEVEKTIYTRRSNRLFKSKEVPREAIERILEAGRFAPSAGNCQPYKFIVITNQNIIHELERRAMFLLRTLKNIYKKKGKRKSIIKTIFFTVASWVKLNSFDPRPITAMEKADQVNNRMFFNAPAVILICKDKRGISNPDLDVGICAQNMVLAAHSMGLGTCYISLCMEPLSYPYMAGFRKKLGVKSPYKAVTSLAIGYSKGKIDKPVKRDTPPVEWIS